MQVRSKERTDRFMARLFHTVLAFAFTSLVGVPARGQISLTSAVDLAVRNNPRVLMAMADVAKATAGLAESRDVYIPSVVGGTNLGYSYGFPIGQPTIFNFQAQSLAFSYSQRDYIRAARHSLDASNLALMDARQTVAEDTVLTYLAIEHDQQRLAALNQQRTFTARLVSIVQDRLAAGQDSAIGLTSAQLTAAQIRLAVLHTEDELAIDRVHLGRLTGLPGETLITLPFRVPELSAVPAVADLPPDSPAVASAYANAQARQEVAFGDARYLWRPQVAFAAAYSRFSSFNNYADYYGNTTHPFQYNAAGLGVVINVPVFDRSRKAKARESAADAAHATHEADLARDQFRDGRFRLQRSTVELAARAEVARLDQQLSQQQLDILLVQLQSGSGNPDGVQMTPKDEQNARITEREKFLTLLDSRFEMQRVAINLLRQTGALEEWLRATAHTDTAEQTPPRISGSAVP